MKITVIVATMLVAIGLCAEDRLSDLDPGVVVAARKLVGLSDLKTTVEMNYLDALDSEVEHFRRLGLEQNYIDEIKDVMMDFFKEVLPYSELEPEFVRFYATKFTEEELKDVIAFAQTPTGKKTLKLSTTIMTAGVKAGQKRVHSRLSDLEKLIMPIVEKALLEKQPGK